MSCPCYHCGKVRRCQMFVEPARHDVHHASAMVYLCAACARELGYEDERSESHGPQHYE